MAATNVYAGAAQSMGGTMGGVFRQTVGDGGWQRLANGLPEGAEVHAITVHPEHPDTVYHRHHQGQPFAAPIAATAGSA